jgi:hypothetical protein
MRHVRALIVAAAATLLLLVNSGGALAVMFGTPDGTGHPYVGLVVFYRDAAATQTLWRCTGTLLSPTVFLTAGHCAGTDGTVAPARAQVWFDPAIVPSAGGYPFFGGTLGTPYPHPLWTGALTIPSTHDVGVVVLDSPHPSSTYGTLPSLNQLDALATARGGGGVTFTLVGYGLQSVRPFTQALRTRYVGTAQLENLTSALTDGYNIQLSSDPGLGNGPGGLCFGDSGGPEFIGASTTIAAVNSFVLNENCAGTSFGHRVDIADSLDFIRAFLH